MKLNRIENVSLYIMLVNTCNFKLIIKVKEYKICQIMNRNLHKKFEFARCTYIRMHQCETEGIEFLESSLFRKESKVRIAS